MSTNDDLIYDERLTSKWTEVLFLTLMLFFFLLAIRRGITGDPDALAIVFFCISCLFLFYSVNFRVLTIRLTPEFLKLTFGVFTWTVPLDNVEGCRLDDLPILMRMGGAGVHFMSIHKRYRVSFNFLEYPRIVIALKRSVGPVRDISFSTRRADDLLRLIQGVVSGGEAG